MENYGTNRMGGGHKLLQDRLKTEIETLKGISEPCRCGTTRQSYSAAYKEPSCLQQVWGRKFYSPIMKYVKIIRDLREDNDLTQSQVAEYLGTSQTMYARYEREASELPVRHLLKLCELYGVSADYILGRVNK